MGYTHYWETKVDLEVVEDYFVSEAVPLILDVCEDFDSIVQYRIVLSNDDKGSYVVLNGKEGEDHETFGFPQIRVDGWDFCKTARKPYDLPVCIILLILLKTIPSFSLSSDGFSNYVNEDRDCLDGQWNEALEYVDEKFGMKFEVVTENTREIGNGVLVNDYSIVAIEEETVF